MSKSILLACPVSAYKSYVLFDWLKYVKKHFGAQCDILLVDNSKDKYFHRKIRKTGISVIYRPPYTNETLPEVMAECLNIINRYLQRGGYEYLFSVECDVYPPPGTLDLLKSYRLDILAASYCIDFGPERKLMYQTVEGITKHTIRNMSQAESFGYVNGAIRPVLNPGLGCTLIRAEVISGYTFYTDQEAWKVHADSFFYRDMKLRNQPVYVHTGIICKHLNSNWNEINKRFEKRKNLAY